MDIRLERYNNATRIKYRKLGDGFYVIKALFKDYIALEIQQEGFDDFVVIVKDGINPMIIRDNELAIKHFNNELKRRSPSYGQDKTGNQDFNLQ